MDNNTSDQAQANAEAAQQNVEASNSDTAGAEKALDNFGIGDGTVLAHALVYRDAESGKITVKYSDGRAPDVVASGVDAVVKTNQFFGDLLNTLGA